MTHVTLILLGLGAILAYTPKWTRPDIYFAVTVGTGFASTPAARRILHQYWLELAIHTLIAWCLALLLGINQPWVLLPAVTWQVIGTSWAIARGHEKTTQYATAPSPMREAELSSRPEKLPGGWFVACGPLIFLCLAGLYAWLFWDDLPPHIAVHWGLHGADRWVDRTPSNVFRFLGLFGSLCASFLLISYGLLRWSRTISVTGERARGEARFRRRTIWLLLGIQYLVVVPGVTLSFWPGMPAEWLWSIVSLIALGIVVALLFRMGQGGSRTVDPAEYEPAIGDRTPDEAWKWGLFYYNPDDPALIVEKRFGMGFTFNFGNRWSWALMVLLLLPVGLAFILR